jgi:hypothetical protein
MNQVTVLVVASDNDERRSISAWLEDAGFADVMICPGPGAPDYTCLGGRGVACPLAQVADLVVVDLKLRSDDVMQGTPGWQLMLYYYEQGKPIVALCGPEDAVHPSSEDQITVIARPIERDEFLAAMRMALPVARAGA